MGIVFLISRPVDLIYVLACLIKEIHNNHAYNRLKTVLKTLDWRSE